jgi:hypothetical protein
MISASTETESHNNSLGIYRFELKLAVPHRGLRGSR